MENRSSNNWFIQIMYTCMYDIVEMRIGSGTKHLARRIRRIQILHFRSKK